MDFIHGSTAPQKHRGLSQSSSQLGDVASWVEMTTRNVTSSPASPHAEK